MNRPSYPPGEPKAETANEFALDSTGTKLKYTVPSGRSAVFHSALVLSVDSGDYAIQYVDSSVVCSLITKSAGTALQAGEITGQYPMKAGDVIRLRVTSAGNCGDSADAYLGLMEIA